MLRQIAQTLSQQSGVTVDAVSLQHADSIPPEELENQPAQVLSGYLQQHLEQGYREFMILPLLFGKSRALTSYIPDQQQILQQQYGRFDLHLAEVLYPLPVGDTTLAQILFANIQQTIRDNPEPLTNIVLVDHGSPLPSVSEVRKRVAEELEQLLGANFELSQAVMERRQGKQYDFNGALLEDCLTQHALAGKQSALVCMMFLLPGRHAGAGGDVNEICAAVMHDFPGFEVYISPLVGEHPLLIQMLNARLQNLLQ